MLSRVLVPSWNLVHSTLRILSSSQPWSELTSQALDPRICRYFLILYRSFFQKPTFGLKFSYFGHWNFCEEISIRACFQQSARPACPHRSWPCAPHWGWSPGPWTGGSQLRSSNWSPGCCPSPRSRGRTVQTYFCTLYDHFFLQLEDASRCPHCIS